MSCRPLACLLAIRLAGAGRALCALLGLLLLVPGHAGELTVAGQWRTGDGLPLDSVSAVALDGEGQLWLGTTDGLARFDGQRFEHFNRDSSPPLPGNRIGNLHRLADGRLLVHLEDAEFGVFTLESGFERIGRTLRGRLVVHGDRLWFVSDAGIEHWNPRDGRSLVLPMDASALALDTFPPADGPRDATPTLMVGTRSGRLHRYDPATSALELVAKGRPGLPVLGIAAGPGGEFAFAQSQRLYRYQPTASPPLQELEVPAEGDSVLHMTWTPSGYLINPTYGWPPLDSPTLFDGHHVRMLGDARTHRFSSIRLSRVDAQGRRWTNEGTLLRRDGVPVFDSPYPIFDFDIDRYGQVWVGTLRGGLLKLVDPLLETIGIGPGELQEPSVYFVEDDGEGGLLVGSYTSLDRYDLASGEWRRLYERRGPAALRDGDGLLVADQRLCLLKNGDCTPVEPFAATPTQAMLLHRDRQGRIWMGAQGGLHYRDADGRWYGPLAPGVRVRTVLELDDGTLLFGAGERGVLSVDGRSPLGSVRTLVDEASGLPSNHVRELFLDGEDELLIGMEDRGLCLYRLGHGLQRCISVANGLPHHSVHRMIADDAGRLWVNSNDGIYALDRRELRDVLHGHTDYVGARRFGVADGMAASEGNGGVNSAGTRTADGRIWFPTQRGVVVVDPARITAQRFPLTVTVRALDEFDRDGDITLPPDRRLLRLWLGAIALRGDGDVQLRYRVDGGRWTSAQPGEITLHGLQPGEHAIEVEARYADNDWLGPTTVLRFDVQPRLAETLAFKLGGSVALALLVIALFARERRLAWRLRRQVAERTESLHSALRTVQQQAERIRDTAERRHNWYLTISHELRTPLTTLLGPLETAQPQPTPRQLERMRRSAQQMRDMIEELLVLERLEHDDDGRFRAERITSLVRRALEPQRPALEAAGVAVECDFDNTLERLRVYADGSQLERAIGTLIGNALKHGAARRLHLVLERGAEDGAIVLHVDDDGPGIPPAERDNVLKPFTKGAGSAPQGMGLGLPLCQRIVQRHRGRLDIGDSPLGGARLSITLPLMPDAATQTAGNAAGDNQVVLVVDDNADIRAHVVELLAGHYHVLQAADGEEGLRIAQAELPDAILSDVNMPTMDGLEMVRRLRAEAETSVIPVIFLTAYGQQEIEARAFSVGGDQFLAKPFRPEQLLLRLQRLFAWRDDLLARHPQPANDVPTPAAAEAPRRPTLVERLDAVLAARIADPDLDVDELCHELGVSRATLYRRLEAASGQTPTDYLRTRRLDRAAEMLRDSNEQVSLIAYAVGFKRLSAFTRSFTTRFGCAPSMYRKSVREALVTPEPVTVAPTTAATSTRDGTTGR